MIVLVFLRSVLVTCLFPFTVVLLGPILIVGHFLFRNKDFDDGVIMLWGKICCRMAGVSVTVKGKENLPREGCLLLFNHSSFFDVFAIAGYLKGVRFGAKAELFKIPIFGKAIASAGTLPIDRKNREGVFKIYDEAKARFLKGEQFVLSPEGGRFYGPQLSPYKSGPFQFAMSVQVPVVPVVIMGAYEALPKGAFLFNLEAWKHEIVIDILPAIPTLGYSSSNRHELIKKVYEQMNPIWVADYKARHLN
jgi:1-acyl-sn-glycerol-3-phosphate acyltransferase